MVRAARRSVVDEVYSVAADEVWLAASVDAGAAEARSDEDDEPNTPLEMKLDRLGRPEDEDELVELPDGTEALSREAELAELP